MEDHRTLIKGMPKKRKLVASDPPKESEPFGTLAEEKLNEIAKKSLTSTQ